MSIIFLGIMDAVFTVWAKLWPILIAVLFFGIIIMVHEIGHFSFAKLFKVKVNEFSLGMGKKLFGVKKGDTKYSVRLFPIGGYVSMEGEDEESTHENSFSNKPVWQRLIIVAAGATINLILGLIMVSVILMQQNLIGTTTIADFDENAVSSSYGLQAGDRITKINGKKTYSSYDVSFLMMRDKDGVIDFEVDRNGEALAVNSVKFETQQIDGRTLISYDFIIRGLEKSYTNVIKYSFLETISISRMVWISVFDLATGQFGLSDISGPVGTVGIIADAASSAKANGIADVLTIMAFITINVGVFNLLPLPALDGGRLFFLFIEAIRRKPISPKYEGYVHATGFALLLLLMVVVTFSDVVKLIKG